MGLVGEMNYGEHLVPLPKCLHPGRSDFSSEKRLQILRRTGGWMISSLESGIRWEGMCGGGACLRAHPDVCSSLYPRIQDVQRCSRRYLWA